MTLLRPGAHLALVCSVFLFGCVSESSPPLDGLDLPEAPNGGVLPSGLAFRLDGAGIARIESSATMEGPKRLMIDLPNALRLVGDRSVDVRYAEAKLDEARQGVYEAAFSFLPDLFPGMEVRAHRDLLQNTTGQFQDVTKQSEFGGLGATIEWNTGNAVFRGLAAARRADAAAAATVTAAAQSGLDVTAAWYDLVRARSLVRIADRALDAAEELRRVEKAREERGAGIHAEVLQADAEVAQKHFQRSQAELQVASASARLAALLELTPNVELVPTDDSPLPVQLVPDDLSMDQLLGKAENARPELRESAALIEASSREREGRIYGPLVPQLDAGMLTGVLGPTYGQSKATNDYAVGLGWKIGPGGLFDIPAINAASARVRQARLRDESLRVEIARQVVDARAHVTASERELVSAREGVSAAREAMRLTNERFTKGVGILLEVLDAQRTLTTAETNEVEAIVHFDRAQFSLLRAIGQPIVAAPPR